MLDESKCQMETHLKINSKMRVWTSGAREQELEYGKSDLLQDLYFQETLQSGPGNTVCHITRQSVKNEKDVECRNLVLL